MSPQYPIELAEADTLPLLQPLFEDMYAHFFKANGLTQLAPEGFRHWQAGYARARGLSRTVYACYDGETPIGFIEGQIRIGSPIVGQGKLGHVAHLYVNPQYRRAGLARALYETQQAWFDTKKISHQTLDVVSGNEVASLFWSALGFEATFTNMIKPAPLDKG